jgi:hypothetical protein
VVEVTGQGSLEGFDWSIDKDQVGARVYDGTPTLQSGLVDGRYLSRARFEQIIVPTQAGVLTLPPATLITFSPKQRKYITHDLSVPALDIEQGVAQDGAFTSFVGQLTRPQEGVFEPTYEGVRPPYATGTAIQRAGRGFVGAWIALTSAPILLWLGLALSAFLRRWWRARALSRIPKEVSIDEALAQLPASSDAQLAVFTQLLTRALSEAGAQVVPETRLEVAGCLTEIDGIRFGAGRPNAGLESRCVALIQALASLRMEAS